MSDANRDLNDEMRETKSRIEEAEAIRLTFRREGSVADATVEVFDGSSWELAQVEAMHIWADCGTMSVHARLTIPAEIHGEPVSVAVLFGADAPRGKKK